MAVEFTETWANLTAWNVAAAGSLQVNAGKVYSLTAAGTMGANRALVLNSAGRGRILGSIIVPAAGGGAVGSKGVALIGVSGNTPGGAPTAALLGAIGVEGATNQCVGFLKGVLDTTSILATPLPAGTYYVSVLVDEVYASLTLRSADGSVERRYALTRASFGAINNVQVWNSDTRGLTGIAIGPVGAKDAGTTLDNRATEGQADNTIWSRITATSPNIIRVQIPKTYESRKPSPLLLYCHGAGETAGAPWDDTLKRQLVNDIAADGFIVASTQTTPTNDWGVQAAVDQYYELYRWVRDHYNVGPVVIFSQSMGGMTGMMSLAERRIPDVVGWVGIYPAVNLLDTWSIPGDPNGLAAQIKAAYGINALGTDYGAKTTGHDPVLKPASVYRRVPARFYASPGDTVVNKATHTDVLAAMLTPLVPEAVVVPCTGNHGDPSHFQSADFRAFLARCIIPAAAPIPRDAQARASGGFRIVLANRAGVPYGEVLGASSKGVSRGLKRPRTARFTVNAGHPLRAILRLTDQVLVKVYDEDDAGTKRLKHVGEITGYQRKGSDDGLTVNIGSTGPDARLDTRLVVKARKAQTNTVTRDYLIEELILQLNTGAGSGRTGTGEGNSDLPLEPITAADTGIRTRMVVRDPAAVATFGDWYYAKASDVLGVAASGLDGPDWHVYPIEPVTDTVGLQIGAMDVMPVIGQARPEVAFEYGTGKLNVTDYEEILDPTIIANDVVHLPPGFPDNALLDPIEQTNAPSIALHGRREAVISGDVSDTNLRTQLLNDNLTVRSDPRRVVQFTVMIDPDPGDLDLSLRRVPRPGIDYDFGDIITFRAVEQIPVFDDAGTITGYFDELVIDAQMRVYLVDEADDELGRRQATLTVVADTT